MYDLAHIMKVYAREAKARKDMNPQDSFANGELLTWYRVISLMQQQGLVFDIRLEDLGLADIDPDNELV
jgi:hypothetical protein